MSHMDPSVETTLDELRTSVTLLGQVIPLATVPENMTDRFFMLGVLDYVRDQTQSFTIKFVSHYTFSRNLLIMHSNRCRLNRTTSKCWENTVAPALGSTILISGYLEGDMPKALMLEIETMQFMPARGVDVFGSPPTSATRRSRFGVAKG